MKVAAVAWKIRPVSSFQDFADHLEELLRHASGQGAELVVLPELLVLELLHLYPDIEENEVPAVLSNHALEYQAAVTRLGRELNMTVVAGSHFFAGGSKYHNVCLTIDPNGIATTHIKNNLTTYERVVWRLGRGTALGRCEDHRIGVTICYDSEFPEAGRVLAESGVLIHCVPAFTEGQRGFQRVRWCCQARAVENQIFVVHSSLVGSLEREPVPETYGSSAVLAPSIEPFPESAVLAETSLNEEGVAVAEVDFQMLFVARAGGDVRNWQDRHSSSWKL